MNQKIGIIGAGAYGTALAQVFSKKHPIKLYNDIESVVEEINNKHTNCTFIGDVKLNSNIVASTDLSTIDKNEVLIIAVPAQAVRGLCKQICGLLPASVPIISCSKGIEFGTGKFMSEVITEYLNNQAFILSGPSFATEISRDMPTSVNLAGSNIKDTTELAAKLSTDKLSLIPTDDVIGVQICGAFKNILAIIIGIIRGLNLGSGAESAVLTKGIQEISGFIKAITGNDKTILTLSGIGDIVMTCLNPTSRNHTFGLMIAKKEIPTPLKADAINKMPLAEGALTLQSWPQIVNRYKKYCQNGIGMPLFSATYALLYEELNLAQLIELAI